MSTDPDAIRSDIERTRTELSSDVDALTDKVSPGRVLHRQGDRLRSAGGSLRDRVMGSAHDAAHGAGDRLGEARDTVTSTPELVRERTAGSPLAAGIVAFGLGLVASALIPASRPEQQLAQAAKEQGEPLVDEAKRAASEVAQNLKEPARDAASQVADTAKQAAQGVRDEAQGARDEVADRARDAQQSVRQSTTGATSGMPGSASGEGVAATFAPATTFEPEETGGGPAAGPLPGDERTSRP